MRCVILAAAVLLAGCASNEYSKVPEPQGEWVPANPASLMAENAPAAPVKPVKAVWRRPVPIVRPAQPIKVNTVAAQ